MSIPATPPELNDLPLIGQMPLTARVSPLRLDYFHSRAVAQFGSALRSGRRGPGFKSRQPDHESEEVQRSTGPHRLAA